MSKKEVLKILDAAAEEFEFPMRDNMSYYPASIKMIVFLYEDNWLITIQELAYSVNDKTFVNTLFGYGNQLTHNGVIDEIEIIKEVKGFPLFSSKDGSFILNLETFEIEIRNTKRKFNLTEEDYEKANIHLSDVNIPNEAKLIRVLSALNPADFFLDEEKTRTYFSINENVVASLELDDWQNPNISEEQLPSDVACFKSLAEAIEKQDLKLYSCPFESCNTHWSNWEWYREY